MNIKFLNSKEKKRIVIELEKQFGIKDIPYSLIKTGKEKIRGYTGEFSKEEIIQLSKLTNIEIIGLYLFRKEYDYRLTIEASQIFKDQIAKNIIEITDEQLQQWLRGQDLEIQGKAKETFIIKNNEDFIGSGKSNSQKIFNYIPKDRRLKKGN